jgi:tungstate transport system ATP-binding protein
VILPLELLDVSFRVHARTIIDTISCRIDAGPRTVILGANGAGKSVLMRLCHGLLRPTQGTVAWKGTAGNEAMRHQAMVFQRPVMLRRSALDNITYALALAGVARDLRRPRAIEALQRVGLTGIAHSPARVLSGGEQQRLALARAWALSPAVLFLDEPTASLDPGATREVESVIQAIHAAGTKIVMTTHDLGQARRLADEILFLHRGRLIERTGAGEFFDRPRTAEAEAFIRGELTWD